MVVGLTGGIACGKTTVANILKSFGAEIIDTDSLGHELLRTDPSVYKRLVGSFGSGILNDKGEIDRPKLGRIVFGDPKCLRVLNEIVHPPLIELTKVKINQILSSDAHKIVVIDAALLIELNLMYMVDVVVLVYADEDVQVQRLMERGLSQEEAYKRIRSQMPLSQKVHFADFIIYTDGPISNTIEQAKRVWETLVNPTRSFKRSSKKNP